MKTTTDTMSFDQLPTDYAGLVRFFMLRPISDDVQLDSATELIDLMAGHDLTLDQDDYLDVLSDLVDKYEQQQHSMQFADAEPIDCLRHLMQEHDMSASALGKLLGDKSLGTRVLHGERSLSKAHITILCDHFKVEPGLFLRVPGDE